MKRFGGMVSFHVTGGEAQALAVCEGRVFTLGSPSAASSRSSSTPDG